MNQVGDISASLSIGRSRLEFFVLCSLQDCPNCLPSSGLRIFYQLALNLISAFLLHLGSRQEGYTQGTAFCNGYRQGTEWSYEDPAKRPKTILK